MGLQEEDGAPFITGTGHCIKSVLNISQEGCNACTELIYGDLFVLGLGTVFLFIHALKMSIFFSSYSNNLHFL